MSATTIFIGTLHAREEGVEEALRSASRGMLCILGSATTLGFVALTASAYIG